jgi:small-conductance mechanosensitive channel
MNTRDRYPRLYWNGVQCVIAAGLLLLPALQPAMAQDRTDAPALPTQADSPEADPSPVGYPVMLDGDTLLTIRWAPLGLGAERRAFLISAMLRETVEDRFRILDTANVRDGGKHQDVYIGDRLMMTVWDEDARLEGLTRSARAEQVAQIFNAAVTAYHERRSGGRMLQRLGFAAIGTLVFVGLFLLGRFGYRRIRKLLEERVHGVHIGRAEVIGEERIRGGAFLLLRIITIVLALALFLTYANSLLVLFPATRGVALVLADLILTPLRVLWGGFVGYIPNLIFIVVIAIVTYYALRLLRILAAEIERGSLTLAGFDNDWAWPTYRIAKFFVIAFAVVVAFPYIPGSSSPAFQGVSIFLGVLFSLGSTSAVANVVAGVILTYMRAFRAEDIVQIGDARGRIISTGLLVTRVRTPKNVEVTIPNTLILGGQVTNFSNQAREGKLILHTSVTIGYDAPWRQVHELLRQAAAKTPGLLNDPAPFVLQTSLDDFYVTYQLNVYTGAPERMLITLSDLHQNIQDLFNEYGVQIMSPNYEADRSAPTVVPKERWYAPPASPPESQGTNTR